MPAYTRAYRPGGTFFLTLVTENRAPLFATPANATLLFAAITNARKHHPFSLDAAVLLPDHLHLLITLPDNDADFSRRVTSVKSSFTRTYLATGNPEQPRSASRHRQRVRGIWLKRFWEHTIRDVDDLNRHFDYIHFNPVKHGHAACPHLWPNSSFHRHVRLNHYAPDWRCQCNGLVEPPAPSEDISCSAGE